MACERVTPVFIHFIVIRQVCLFWSLLFSSPPDGFISPSAACRYLGVRDARCRLRLMLRVREEHRCGLETVDTAMLPHCSHTELASDVGS